MILKPGWIIAMVMLWFVIQLGITIGDTIYTPASLDANSGEAVSSAPIMRLMMAQNKIDTINGSVGTDWLGVLSDLREMFTFQAPFLTGSWYLITIFLNIIYMAFTLALLFMLAPTIAAGLGRIGNAIGNIVGGI